MTTPQDIEQSYVFKIVKRILKKQYKWIKDVEIDKEDFDNYKYNIFLTLTIDPYELAQEKDWEVARWVVNEPNYEASILGMFFKGRDPNYSQTTDDIQDFMYSITNSPAIPDDLRLPKPKNEFMVGNYISTT
jgi:hypothetical protein